jgi:serine/threonine protein kinase
MFSRQRSQAVEVGSHKLKGLKLLAEGGFSFIYRATSDGKILALKEVRVQRGNDDLLELARNEVETHRGIPTHPNVIRFLESAEIEQRSRDGCSVYTVLELCPQGSVFDLMQREGKLSEDRVLTIFRDAAQAVTHLHRQSPPIAHRDLKVENLLLGEDGNFKLCDFGSCSRSHRNFGGASNSETQLATDEISKSTTIAYRSPEQVDLWAGQYVGERVDVWALGCLLYKLIYQYTPFEDQSTGQASKMAILSGRFSIKPDHCCRPAVIDLIRYQLVLQVADRSIDSTLTHSLLPVHRSQIVV